MTRLDPRLINYENQMSDFLEHKCIHVVKPQIQEKLESPAKSIGIGLLFAAACWGTLWALVWAVRILSRWM